LSKIGPPDCPEATKIAQAFVKAAPERLVWGILDGLALSVAWTVPSHWSRDANL
jgi:hypothetical protein